MEAPAALPDAWWVCGGGLVVAFGLQAGWRFAVARRGGLVSWMQKSWRRGSLTGKGHVPLDRGSLAMLRVVARRCRAGVPGAIEGASANPSYANIGDRAQGAFTCPV